LPAWGTQWGPGGYAPAALEHHCDPYDWYSWVDLRLVDCLAVDIAADTAAAAAVVDIVAGELVDTAEELVAVVDTAPAAVSVAVADIVDIVAETAPAVVDFAVLVVVAVVAPGPAAVVVEVDAAVAGAAVAQPTAESNGRCH